MTPDSSPPLSERTDVRGRRVTVMGLGRFGGQLAAIRYLLARDARVVVTDSAGEAKLADSLRELDGLPLTFHLGGHVESDFTETDLVVVSPAVPPTNPFLLKAHAAGVRVVTEIELTLERIYARNPEQTVIGVTGTKGKSTTTALLGRMLASTFPTHVGGNIGRPLLNQLDTIGAGDLVLLELSSFMLHYLGRRRFRPHVAVVTLVSADHLDWHGSLEAYIDAKRQLVRYQRPTDHAVLCATSEVARGFAHDTAAQVHLYGPPDPAERIPMRLPGEHNQLNAAGALRAATLLGVPRQQALAAVADFGGLPHRLELVHESGGVRYYNDSIATVPEAAVAALRSFPPDTVLQIAGGSDKGLDLSPLVAALRQQARAVLCIGTLGPKLAAEVGPKAELCQTLDVAVSRARQLARPGDVVLLSPGCASYDQFPHFEARGDAFRRLVCGGGPEVAPPAAAVGPTGAAATGRERSPDR
ncbi:MAG: UDP-N-acetylmuramoyl-L-alanine--D-glutamate ligase [Tepidisphaerales bacterium]